MLPSKTKLLLGWKKGGKEDGHGTLRTEGTLFFLYFIYFNWRLIILQYCIGFAIHRHESTTGVHAFPNMNPLPTSLNITSLWVIPVHQPQACCILHQHRLAIRFLHDSIHVSMPFSQIIPPSPSPSESKSLLYTSVSFFAVLHTGSSLPSF